MRYEVQWNRLRGEWLVWKVWTNGAEVVKRFKAEQTAQRWVDQRMGKRC